MLQSSWVSSITTHLDFILTDAQHGFHNTGRGNNGIGIIIIIRCDDIKLIISRPGRCDWLDTWNDGGCGGQLCTHWQLPWLQQDCFHNCDKSFGWLTASLLSIEICHHFSISAQQNWKLRHCELSQCWVIHLYGDRAGRVIDWIAFQQLWALIN